MPAKTTVRVVTRASDGTVRIKDYPNTEPLLQMHTQIGIDDCSTDLALRGYPLFRGLIGPMPEGKQVVRYESPDVFEALTKEWTKREKRPQIPAKNAPAGGNGNQHRANFARIVAGLSRAGACVPIPRLNYSSWEEPHEHA